VLTNILYKPGRSALLASEVKLAPATIKIAELMKMATMKSVMQSSAIVYDKQDLIVDKVGRYRCMANLESEARTSCSRLWSLSRSRMRGCTRPEPK